MVKVILDIHAVIDKIMFSDNERLIKDINSIYNNFYGSALEDELRNYINTANNLGMLEGYKPSLFSHEIHRV